MAPPASHLVGQYALVFCLVGYGCGLLRGILGRSAWLPLGVVAVGSAAGEALYALTGMMFGDPDITWPRSGRCCPPRSSTTSCSARSCCTRWPGCTGMALQGLSALSGGRTARPAHAAAGRRGRAARRVGRGGPGQRDRPGAAAARPALRAGATQGGSASGGRGPGRGAAARPVQLHFGGAGAMQGGSASSPRIPRKPPSRPVSLRLGSRNWASRYSHRAARPGR